MRLNRVLTFAAVCLAPFLALAQQVNAPAPQPAGISGTVVDIQDAVIPGAAVVLHGPAPSDQAATTSNGRGFFTFSNLRPTIPYRITVSADGFAPWTSAPLILSPGQVLDLPAIRLSLSMVQTTVTAMTTQQIATQEVHAEEKQRVFAVFPNFYVTYATNPVPLTPKLKFQLALRSLIDPVNLATTAGFAGLNQITDTPDYPQTVTGYFQRFATSYADGVTSSLIGNALLPSLLHQDPRYFYQGTGTTRSRLRHAIASAFLQKNDNGRWQFAYSYVGGDLASGAISNLYYPPANRGASVVVYNALFSVAGRTIDNLAQEFILPRFTSHAPQGP